MKRKNQTHDASKYHSNSISMRETLKGVCFGGEKEDAFKHLSLLVFKV